MLLLNADLGESWYDRRVGNDTDLMPHLDACNVACGFHGGDAATMLRTVKLAKQHGVKVGAHPSYADRKNFGRVSQSVDPATLRAQLLYQVGGLRAMLESEGLALNHVKAHGALYHDLAYGEDDAPRSVFCAVVAELGCPLVFGPPGSRLETIAGRYQLGYLAEGFADRAYDYHRALHLRPRQLEGAILPESAAIAQTQNALAGYVITHAGRRVPVTFGTWCVHGDQPGAARTAAAIRALLGSK